MDSELVPKKTIGSLPTRVAPLIVSCCAAITQMSGGIAAAQMLASPPRVSPSMDLIVMGSLVRQTRKKLSPKHSDGSGAESPVTPASTGGRLVHSVVSVA